MTIRDDSKSFYVYLHVDPIYKETMYIGIGQYDRAWCIRKNQRKKNHVEWVEELFNQGFTLSDIVKITHNRISKQEALSIERQMIESVKPKFNELMNPDHWLRNRQHPKHIAEFASLLYQCGYSYVNTAYLMGANKGDKHMTIKRMINNVA